VENTENVATPAEPTPIPAPAPINLDAPASAAAPVAATAVEEVTVVKKRRGRPPGSSNKTKPAARRGRPPKIAKAPKAAKAPRVAKVKTPKVAKPPRVAGVKAQGQVAKIAMKTLKGMAKDEGVRVAELVRRAVHKYVGHKE